MMLRKSNGGRVLGNVWYKFCHHFERHHSKCLFGPMCMLVVGFRDYHIKSSRINCVYVLLVLPDITRHSRRSSVRHKFLWLKGFKQCSLGIVRSRWLNIHTVCTRKQNKKCHNANHEVDFNLTALVQDNHGPVARYRTMCWCFRNRLLIA